MSVLISCLAALPLVLGQSPSLKDVSGRIHQPLVSKAKPSVLIFISTDCPIANKMAPEIRRIHADFSRKIDLFLVHVDRSLKPEGARKHASEFGHKSTILLDSAHELVKSTGARVTPEAFVYRNGKKLYSGRINDLYYQLGRRRTKPTRHDLRDAIDAVLAGKAPSPNRTEPIGCFIPDE